MAKSSQQTTPQINIKSLNKSSNPATQQEQVAQNSSNSFLASAYDPKKQNQVYAGAPQIKQSPPILRSQRQKKSRAIKTTLATPVGSGQHQQSQAMSSEPQNNTRGENLSFQKLPKHHIISALQAKKQKSSTSSKLITTKEKRQLQQIAKSPPRLTEPEDMSDLINDTIDQESPAVKEADLRRSLTASQRENLASINSHVMLRSSQSGKDLFVGSGHQNMMNRQTTETVMNMTGIDRFANVQVPEILDKSGRQNTGASSSGVNMLKLYQNANQSLSRQPGINNLGLSRGAEGINNDTTITQNFEDIRVPAALNFDNNQLVFGEENLLEQTLGQTLTQQKKILDQIQQETENRNHMHLMNRYLDDKCSVQKSSLQDSQIRQLSQQISSSSKNTASVIHPIQVLSYEKGHQAHAVGSKAVFNAPQIIGRSITTASGPITKTQNTPRQLRSEANDEGKRSSSALLRSVKNEPSIVSNKNQDKRLQMFGQKASTTNVSPRYRIKSNLQLDQSSDEDQEDDDDMSIAERNLVRFKLPDTVTQKNRDGVTAQVPQSHHFRQPSQSSLKTTSTPGQAMNSLKDSRSLSRLDIYRPVHVLNKDGNSNTTGKKTQGGRPAFSRDLSMPRLHPKGQKQSDDLIPATMPRRQNQFGQLGNAPLMEFNKRLSNLTVLHGPPFITAQYKSLKVIDIRNNRISELPDEICSLPKLSHLKLDYNYLQALPFSLGSIRTLTYISCSQNRLQELPDSLFHKESQLESLLVNDNKLKVLQKGLGQLVCLRTLYLHNNVLIEIPVSLCNLLELAEFSLDWLLYVEGRHLNELDAQTSFNPAQIDSAADNQKRDSKVGDRVTMKAPNNQSLVINTAPNNEKDEIKKQGDNGEDTRKNTHAVHATPGNRKVLKGEKGAALIQEIRVMVQLIDKAQRSLRLENGILQYKSIGSSTNSANQKKPSRSLSGYVHFLQFLMYLNRVHHLSEVRHLRFSHKQRLLIHQLAIHGHLYLLKTSIAVLGINRPQTSLDLNAPDEDNSTALLLAMKQKRFDLVKYLLRLPQTKTNVKSLKYGLPLHVALAQSEFKLASKIIKTYFAQNGQTDAAFEVDVNVANEYGNTPLHIIFLNFQKGPDMALVLAKLLIKKGANLHARNHLELGHLHLAVQTNNVSALQFAVAHNKMVRQKRLKSRRTLSLVNDEPDSELFDFDVRGGKHEWTVLHMAIYHTNLAIITLLMQCGEFIDLMALDSVGRRAIDLCPYSSPVFKSIRDLIKRKTKQQVVELSLDKSFQQEREIFHNVFSARDCTTEIPERQRLENMQQQLQILKQLPADQLRQDVPPGPGPFPQKVNYNSNLVMLSTFGGGQNNHLNSQIDEAQRDAMEYSSELMMSNKDYKIAVPEALRHSHVSGGVGEQFDLAMNVPTSFDHRDLGATLEGLGLKQRKDSRKNSNHLEILGVTNPNKNEYQTNQNVESTAQVRLSSLKDEDNLNSHWLDLMQQEPPKPAYKPDGKTDQPFQEANRQESQCSITDHELLNKVGNFRPGSTKNNLMIYSTLAAAFPYELNQTSAHVQEVQGEPHHLRNNSNRKIQQTSTFGMPKLIETGTLLDLSLQNTEIKLDLAKFNKIDEDQGKSILENDEGDDDSGDNLDDIDEKVRNYQGPKRSESPISDQGTSTMYQLELQIGTDNSSDGENVDGEDDEMQTKAFEARESQWNRKLSIKQSEEKRINQVKSSMALSIVKAFEEARNYYAVNPTQMSRQSEFQSMDNKPIDVEKRPSVVAQTEITNQKQESKDSMQQVSKAEQELVLSSDQDEILKPLKSANLSFKGPGSSPDLAIIAESPITGQSILRANRFCLKESRLSEGGGNNNLSLMTHNFNLMSTVKVTDLKLHLNQNNAEYIAAAESHRVFGEDDNLAAARGASQELQNIVKEIFIAENDSNVLLWAHEQTTIKIRHSIKLLIQFIEILAVAQITKSPQEYKEEDLPNVSKLILNLHELENMYMIKTNEAIQKQSMKLIIINSTGRHRKAPSDFQSAKTLKRHEMQNQQVLTRPPSLSRTRQLLGPIFNDPNKMNQKNYRVDDSMLQYDSNNAPQLYQNNIRQRTRADNSHNESPQRQTLGQSQSSQFLHQKRKSSTSTLRDLISHDIQPPYQKVNSSNGSSNMRRQTPIAIRSRDKSQSKSTEKSLSKLVKSSHILARHNQNLNVIGRNSSSNVGFGQLISREGRVNIASRQERALSTQHPISSQMTFGGNAASTPNLQTTLNQSPVKPMTALTQFNQMKKGVTSGMKLVQPVKKTDDFNLDLTMQIDANEDVRAAQEESKSPYQSNSANLINDEDESKSQPQVHTESQQPLSKRMIGDINQFSKLMQASKDNFERRITEKGQVKRSRGLGMHERQQDPLGSIALSSHDSNHKKPPTQSFMNRQESQLKTKFDQAEQSSEIEEPRFFNK